MLQALRPRPSVGLSSTPRGTPASLAPTRPGWLRRARDRGQLPTGPPVRRTVPLSRSRTPMALNQSQLYSSHWQGRDRLRGGMDASQYKNYVLVTIEGRQRRVRWAADCPHRRPHGCERESTVGALTEIETRWESSDTACVHPRRPGRREARGALRGGAVGMGGVLARSSVWKQSLARTTMAQVSGKKPRMDRIDGTQQSSADKGESRPNRAAHEHSSRPAATVPSHALPSPRQGA